VYHSKNIEIQIVDHCNLDCIACSHESPLVVPWFQDPARLSHDISILWKWYRTELVKLLGGEPLLHPAINEVIAVIRARTDARIRVVTNGVLLSQRYPWLIGVDEIHISCYTNASIPADDDLKSIAKEVGVPITIQAFGHFRWHRSQTRNGPKLVQQIFATCQQYHLWQCHTLRGGWFYACPAAATWARGYEEGVDLSSALPDRQEKLEQLLMRSIPFKSCDRCLGSVGHRLSHHQGSRKLSGALSESEVDLAFLRQLQKNNDVHNGCFHYERTILPSGYVQFYGD